MTSKRTTAPPPFVRSDQPSIPLTTQNRTRPADRTDGPARSVVGGDGPSEAAVHAGRAVPPTATRPTGLSRSEVTGIVALFVFGSVVLVTSSIVYAGTLRALAGSEGVHPLLREEGFY
jgi:hypothetical protein